MKGIHLVESGCSRESGKISIVTTNAKAYDAIMVLLKL